MQTSSGSSSDKPKKKKRPAESSSSKPPLMKKAKASATSSSSSSSKISTVGHNLVKKKKKSTTSSSTTSTSTSSSSSSKPSSTLHSRVSAFASSSILNKKSDGTHDEDTWEGCWEGARRRQSVADGVAWLLRYDQQHPHQHFTEEGEVVPAVAQLARLTMDPVRQEVLETAHPALDRWKVASVPKRWEAEYQQTHTPTHTHTHTYGNSKQASLIQAFRRIVQLEKMGVHMQEATKQSLLESFISTEDAARLPIRGSPRKNKITTTTTHTPTQTTWSIKDYLGWNPLEGPPPASLPDPFDATQTLSKHCVLALSLELVLLLELSGLVQNDDAEEGMGMYDEEEDNDKEDEKEEDEDTKPSPTTTHKINTSKQRKALSKEGRVVHILQYLPSLRPYLGPTQVNTQTYHDQVLLASSVVRALSRGGELRMPALLMPHEYFFLREHVPVHLLNRNVLLLARSVDALRVLGSHDENPIMRASMSFLMGVQGFNGSWPLSLGGDVNGGGGGGGGSNGGTSSSSSSSSALSLLVSPTLSAVRALLVREFVGYGPLPLEVVDVLLAMQKEDADAPVESLPAAQDEEVVFLLPDGRLDNRLKDVTRLVTKMKKRQVKRERQKEEQQQQQQQEGGGGGGDGGGGGGGGKNSRSNSIDSASRTLPSEPPSLAKTGTATSSSSISSLPTLVPPPPSTTTTATPTDTAAATRIQKQGKEIEKAKEENNWSLVLKGLQALDRENMTLQLLSTTGIGKVVGKLKKVEGEGAAAVVELSKKLVKKWKGLVPVA